jgi:membrane AbrB-like protein
MTVLPSLDRQPPLAAAARTCRNTAQVCLPAALGGAAFAALSLPAPWLTGGLLFSAAASLFYRPAKLPDAVKDTAIIVLGIAVGTTVTPGMLHHVANWPISIALLLITVYLMLFASYATLTSLFKWRADTALWSSAPGALTASLAMAEETGADVRSVTAIHMTRVLAVSLLLPFALSSRETILSNVAQPFDIASFVFLLIVGFVVAAFFKRASIPGGMLLGAFSSSALLSATGLVTFSMPAPISAVACIVFATFIGGQFSGTQWRIFYRLALASAVTFIVSFVISAIAALLAVILLHLPFSQALIAYAPGGLDVLILVSYLLKVDPAFVSTHHFVRLLVLILTLPAIGRWIGRPGRHNGLARTYQSSIPSD